MNKIRANESLRNLIQNNQTALSMWEKAENPARMILNIWATMNLSDQNTAVELFRINTEQRRAELK